jgi:hypothetical protein
MKRNVDVIASRQLARHPIAVLVVAGLVGLIYAETSLAWGKDGHQLVCAQAEQSLTPTGKRWLNKVMAGGKELDDAERKHFGRSFALSCLWPDDAKYSDYKGSYEQHFINVPSDANTVDMARDCTALDCIIVGIQRALSYLAQPVDGRRQRARAAAALRFLGHYIGDLHQPLHVSNAADWGGNKIKVTWFSEDSNLHRVWDVGLLAKDGLDYPAAMVSLTVGAEQVASSKDVLEWMNESLRVARRHAYKHRGVLIASGAALGADYVRANSPIAKRQIELAAGRLAGLINGLADKSLQLPMLVAGN